MCTGVTARCSVPWGGSDGLRKPQPQPLHNGQSIGGIRTAALFADGFFICILAASFHEGAADAPRSGHSPTDPRRKWGRVACREDGSAANGETKLTSGRFKVGDTTKETA